MVSYDEVPGNSKASALAYQRALIRFAEKVNGYEHTLDRMFEADVLVKSMSIRHPQDEGDEYLIIMRIVDAGEALVGFHGAATLFEALEGLINRLRNKTMKWKPDAYANE